MKNTFKTIAFILWHLFFAVRSFGQSFDVKYSEPISNLSRNYILPVDGGGFIGMKKEDKTGYGSWNKYRRIFTFIQYDKSMKPVKEMHPADKGFLFTVFFSDFKKIGNKYWLFYIEPAEKKTIGDLKAVEINPATLELGTPKILAKSDAINLQLKLFFGLVEVWTKIKSSPDGNRIGFAMSTGKSDFFMTCFDQNLDVLWSRNETNPLPNEIAVSDFETDNAGTAYLAFTVKDQAYVGVYNSTEKKLVNIETGKIRLYGIYLLAQQKTPSVVVAGMYYDGTKNLAGVYKAAIDGNAHMLTGMQRTAYPESIVALFDKDSYGSVKPGKYGIEPGFLAQMVEMNDGTVALVAETKRIMDGPNFTVVHSGSILTICFGAQGASFARLPKYNVAAGTYWKHFYASSSGNKLLVFYNDNPANLTKDINASPKLVDIEDNSVLVAAVIEPNGEVKRTLPIATTEKYEGVAEYLQPLSENILAVPIFQKKKNVYAAITVR